MTNDADPNPLDALRRSVPDDHEFGGRAADRIESRLRILHAEAAPSSRPRWRPALVVPAIAAVVVALSIGFALRSSEPVAALIITDAENVTVRLPDGSFVVDPSDGFELPDGAVVEIGAGGMVTVDDIVLDGAGVLAVRDGRLVADVIATTTTPQRPDHLEPDPTVTISPGDVTTTAPSTTAPDPTPSTTPEPEAPATTEPNGRDGHADDEPVDPRTDDRADERDERRDEGDDQRDPPLADEEPDGDPPPPNDESDATDRDGEPGDGTDATVTVTIALELERVDDGVAVAWNVGGLQPGWSVVIARAVGDQPPIVVVSSTDASGRILDQPTRDDGQPTDRRVRYRLIVLDEAGGQVASGPPQSLR